MGKKPANPYKLQPVAKAEAKTIPVPEDSHRYPRPSIAAGQLVTCSLKPLFYTIPDPAEVIDVVYDTRTTSHWWVIVDTSSGIQKIDSRLFKPFTKH